MENKIKEAIDEIQRGTAEIIDIEAITKLIKKPQKMIFFNQILRHKYLSKKTTIHQLLQKSFV